MATVKIDRFGGISPRMHPSLLADGMAVTAHNLRLKNGKIVPLRQPSVADSIRVHLENGLPSIGSAKSMHVWKQNSGNVEILAFPGTTWCARGNIADDENSRVIVSGDTGVQFVDDNLKPWSNTPQMYLIDGSLGKVVHPLCKNSLPAPKAYRATETTLLETKRYTYFFWTWVDKYGYESPVSDPSLVQAEGSSEWVSGDIEYNDGDTIGILKPIASDVPYEADRIRVYKVVTGTETGRIQFVAEFDVSTALTDNLLFTVKDEDAGEVISEIESPPPDIRNIIRVFGGGAFYAGFSASSPKTVCFSDVGLPYSWPTAYKYDVDDNIVALASTSNTVFALTDGYPYVITGTAPESMNVTPLAGPAACVSARSVCVFENAVYYASNIGICTIFNNSDAGTVVKNLTDKVWTKEQWEELNPSSCVICQYDGALHCFMQNGPVKNTFIIDLVDGMVTTVDEHASCVCRDDATDRMYFVRSED